MTVSRLLFAAPHRGVPGPIRAHTELLCEQFGHTGVASSALGWGQHAEGESARAKVTGRASDIRAILRHLTANEPEALVVRTAHDWKTLLRDLPLVILARRRASHVVIQFHGSQIERAGAGTVFGAATQWLVSRSDGVLLLSEQEAAAWRTRFPLVKVAVVSNAFQEWPQAGECESRRIDEELDRGVGILFVGRLIPEKGAMEIVEALPLLPEGLRARLVIVGTGPDEPRLRERVKALGLEDRVRFAGQTGRDDLAVLYRESQIFVLPTYWAEGFPTVLSEAMSFGLPIVTTAQRGAADHLVSDVNAVFVPPMQAESVATAIVAIARDPRRAAAMGAANRQAVKRFYPQAVAPAYLTALSELCGERFGAAAGSNPRGADT